MLRASVGSLCTVFFLLACGGERAVRSKRILSEEQGPVASAPKTDSPKLVVSIILDQFGEIALNFHREALLANEGLLAQMLQQGERTQLLYPYAGTYTAPGHASLHTGTLPYEHGVWGNRFWDTVGKKKIAWENDGEHTVFGYEDRFASPLSMKRRAVGSWLKQAKPEAKVAVVSLKARAAIASAGHAQSPEHKADAVFWLDKANRRFTSSSYYFEALPSWATDWAEENAPDLSPWTPLDAEALQKELGDDHQPGEGGWGAGSTFPHASEEADDVMGAFVATPASSAYLLGFTKRMVEQLELGEDETPDLLVVSVSGTDYVGHTFGIHSWEYRDNLLRVDRMLRAFVEELRQDKTIAVALTSDHGSAPLPERSEREGKKASRHDHRFAEAAQELMQKRLGKGAWVEAFVKPYLYLGNDGRKNAGKVLAYLKATLPKRSEIFAVYDPRNIEKLRTSKDATERAVAATMFAGQTGDLFVVTKPLHILDDTSSGAGTSHGTPWNYDALVPILLDGPATKTPLAPKPVGVPTYSQILSEWLGLSGDRG